MVGVATGESGEHCRKREEADSKVLWVCDLFFGSGVRCVTDEC